MLDESCDMAAGHLCPYDEVATCVDAPNAPEDCWEDRDKRDKLCETYTIYQQRERIRVLEEENERLKARDSARTFEQMRQHIELLKDAKRTLERELAKERNARADLVRRVEEVAEAAEENMSQELYYPGWIQWKEHVKRLRNIVKEG